MKPTLSIGFLVALGIFAVFAVYSVWFPYALDYGEGPLLDQARRLAAGDGLYRAAWNQPPYVINNYPPVYPAVVAALSWFGPLLRIGRLVSILSTLASAALLNVIARRLWLSRSAGLLAAALFLGNVFVVEWAILARVDSLALALSLAALALVQTRQWRWLAPAVVCATLAIFTRQTYGLAVPLAAVVVLERRQAIVFATALAALSTVLFFVLNHVTAGGFYFHIVAANVNHYQWLRVPEFGARLLFVCAPALLLVFLTRRESRPPLLVAYTVGAALTALTVGKVGSWHNYFLELMVAIIVWTASAKRLVIAPLAWGAITTVALLTWKLSVGWQERAGYAAIAARVRAAAAPVLADDAMTMIVAAGKPLYYQPFELRQLQTAGEFDPSPVVAAVEERRFGLIVLRWPGQPKCRERWGPELLAAIQTHYKETLRAGALVAYEPSQVVGDASIGRGVR